MKKETQKTRSSFISDNGPTLVACSLLELYYGTENKARLSKIFAKASQSRENIRLDIKN